MDPQLITLMEEINISPNIVTINSCYGHPINERGYISHPYFSFRVNEKGWNLFWRKILPNMAENMPVEVLISDDKEKFGISMYCDYLNRDNFWERIGVYFPKYFLKEEKEENEG
jgi:hypothetical protein